jgi:hypothetical protein
LILSAAAVAAAVLSRPWRQPKTSSCCCGAASRRSKQLVWSYAWQHLQADAQQQAAATVHLTLLLLLLLLLLLMHKCWFPQQHLLQWQWVWVGTAPAGALQCRWHHLLFLALMGRMFMTMYMDLGPKMNMKPSRHMHMAPRGFRTSSSSSSSSNSSSSSRAMPAVTLIQQANVLPTAAVVGAAAG